MKNLIYVLLLLPLFANSQTLVDTPGGDEINLPNKFISADLENIALFVKANTSSESLELKYIFLIKDTPKTEVLPEGAIGADAGGEPLVSNYWPLIFGYKIKPTEGIGNIYSKGDFQGAMTFNFQTGRYWVVEKGPLENEALFANLSLSYDLERLTMMYPERAFTEQIDKSYFKGFSSIGQIGLFIKGKWHITASSGYARKNNYKDLTKITINDFTLITESDITRAYGAQETGRLGNFKKFDRYPTKIAITLLPSEDEKEKKQAKLGGTFYYSCDYGNIAPLHTLGIIAFLTKQDKDSGIRIPTIGVGLQAKDITDNLNKDNAFEKRLSVNVSATISVL